MRPPEEAGGLRALAATNHVPSGIPLRAELLFNNLEGPKAVCRGTGEPRALTAVGENSFGHRHRQSGVKTNIQRKSLGPYREKHPTSQDSAKKSILLRAPPSAKTTL